MANHDTRKGRSDGAMEWLAFPGGELEGERPSARCPACLETLNHERSSGSGRHQTPGSPDAPPRARTLCFQCYRMQVEKNRALRTAGNLNTASEARFTSQLPFETVDTPRLEMLKAQRLQARDRDDDAVARRRRAQIAARHALKTTVATLNKEAARSSRHDRARELAFAIRAAELQLPESWLPFVVAQ